jgi:epoxide hydrolase-like predicted phosphatase
MPIRAVIFDFGGVLLRTGDQSGRRKWEARLGLPEGSLARLVYGSEASARASVGQVPVTKVWEHVAETLELTNEQLLELQRDFWAGNQLDAELVQFIRDLRPRYKTALLSNAWPDGREAFTRHFGLDSVMDAMIISAEEGMAKPDARIYEIATKRLGVRPEEAVFVDDTAKNVQAARAVGMKGVQFENTAQAIAEVQQYLDS